MRTNKPKIVGRNNLDCISSQGHGRFNLPTYTDLRCFRFSSYAMRNAWTVQCTLVIIMDTSLNTDPQSWHFWHCSSYTVQNLLIQPSFQVEILLQGTFRSWINGQCLYVLRVNSIIPKICIIEPTTYKTNKELLDKCAIWGYGYDLKDTAFPTSNTIHRNKAIPWF